MLPDANSLSPPEAGTVRRRLTGDQRRALIIEAASRTFAEDGFTGTTREIAKRLGVTQALLYRYFSSKEALVDAVFDHLRSYWDESRSDILRDTSLPLRERMCRFYDAYLLRRTDFSSARLFMHAALAGIDLPLRYGVDLDRFVLLPVVAALRAEAGLPPPPMPLPPEERELALGLHGGLVFIGIRRHIYGAKIDDERHLKLVNGLIDTWLPGALERIKLSCDN